MKKSFLYNKARIVRFLAGFAALVAIIFCSVKIATAVKYDLITVSGTKGNITVNGNSIDKLTITPALVFNTTNDSITYKTTLSNPNGEKFQIKDISDDNTNQYITTSYEFDEEKNDSDKPIFITLTYSSYLPFGDDLNLSDIHITIDVDEDTPASAPASAPNTGANGAQYLKPSTTKNTTILPYIIICIISVAIIITVAPLPKKHRVQFNKISVVVLAMVASGIALNTFAATSKVEVTIVGAHISAVPDTSNPQEVVSITFPNIYNNKVTDRPDGAAPGNVIILKTLDDKYVMMDTGPKTANIREVIYNAFKELQGRDDIVVDYLVISHLDGDHYGNATTLMNDEHFTFKNIIYKHEIYANGADEAIFQSLSQTAIANNVNIITSGDATTVEYLNSLGVANYDKVNEGMVIQVGKYLKLDFFNTSNVYAGKTCQEGLTVSWTANASSTSLYQTADGKYVYFDGSEYNTKANGSFSVSSIKYPYADVTLRTTTTPVAKENGSGMNRYFYAVVSSDTHNICTSNPNAFGILAEVTTTNLKRYMYFPGDLENAGYGRLSSGANSAQLFGDNVAFENGDFTSVTTPYTIASEDDTAAAIYDKLASDASALGLNVDTLLNNIVIYQESHHGGNNSEKAVWKLNMNRSSGIYAIAETATNMATTVGFNAAKTYWYTLGNVPAENKLRVGDSTIDGVGCTINTNGNTFCSQYTEEIQDQLLIPIKPFAVMTIFRGLCVDWTL